MKLVILGGPGAGKGLQSALLHQRLSIPIVAIGDVFRAAIAAESDLGQQAKPYVERGELVPDRLAVQFVRDRLAQPDLTKSWLLDGYPRTAPQAQALDSLLGGWNQKLDRAIYLKVSPEVMMERTMYRARKRPDEARTDDRPAVVRRRIELFFQRTEPMLEYYEHSDRLLVVEGDGSPEEAGNAILRGLGFDWS